MVPPPIRLRIDSCSLQLAEHADAFVMEVAEGGGETVRLEFPSWLLPQLMRVLPRIDAAIRRGDSGPAGAPIAYPLDEWRVASAGPGLGVTIQLRDDRQVDTAFHLGVDEALALHCELGDAIVGARSQGS
jgi:hypothetical protein